jgi:toxin ParE1/3/4
VVQVVWSRRALTDLAAIRAYISQFNPTAAARMAARLETAGESLVSHPLRGRPAIHGLRALTTVPPYLVYYRVEEKTVVVVTIRHGARRPI